MTNSVDIQGEPGAISSRSVVSDRIDIQKLIGKNWTAWKWQVLNILDSRNLRLVLTSQEPTNSPRELAARQIIASSIDQSVINKIIHCTSVQEIWSALTSLYENKTSFALTDLLGRMNNYRIKSLDQIEDGISEIRTMSVQIQAMGGAIDANTVESAILRALPKSFSNFITSWTFLDQNRRTVDNLQSHILRHVHMIKSEEATRERALVAKHIRNGDKSKDKSQKKRSNITCNYCKKNGHKIS